MRLIKNLVACGVFVTAGAAYSQTIELNNEHVPNQLIVKFDDSMALQEIDEAIEFNGGKIIKRFRSSGAVLIEYKEKAGTMLLEARANTLLQRNDVKYVESNDVIRLDKIPNDPKFGELYALNNEGGTGGSVDADIDAVEAWDITTGSKDVLVGIIDTGVDYTHPDIAPNYWTNSGETGLDAEGNDKSTNEIDDDNNGYVDDFRGWDFANNDNDPIDDHNHGTHCAGTIGAKGDDGVGVVGVNWNVSLVGIKFLTGSGSGTTDGAISSIEYATKIGVTLTSNSWGGGGFSEAMKAAIDEANDAGVLFVAAAGNSTSNNDSSPHYPSSYSSDNVLAVAATDDKDGIASFSSYGLTSVDVGAPGVNILSTTKDNSYDKYSGTSMATPHVAGVAALIKSHYPNATAAELKARIMNTVDPVASLAGKTITGGRVNVESALENDEIAPGPATDVRVVGSTATSVGLAWFSAGDDGDDGFARRYEIRQAENPIDSIEAWDAAGRSNANILVTPGRSAVTGTISDLPYNSKAYVAVRAYDNVGNVGPVSESIFIETLEVAIYHQNLADSLDGVSVEGAWGLEQGDEENSSFSDSPEGDYEKDQNASLTLNPITLESAEVSLVFSAKYDIEAGYDFVFVEISTNGTDWVELDKITGNSGWTQKNYELKDHVNVGDQMSIRFRLVSDYSIQKAGLQVDNIQLFAPK